MRIPIRVQLGALLLISSLLALAVISIAVWVTVHEFVFRLRTSRLALIASLKAAQLVSNLDVLKTASGFVTSRVLIQNALARYNAVGNNTAANWNSSIVDMRAALGGAGSTGQRLLLQTRVYGKNASGPGGSDPLLSATAQNLPDAQNITLPYVASDGSPVVLGDNLDSTLGYPPPLYPNLTFFDASYAGRPNVSHAIYEDRILMPNSTLLLGPWAVNSTYYLLSLTQAILNNSDDTDVLGWLTAVMDASLIAAVVNSPEGLDNTGETLLLGPASSTNVFPQSVMNMSTAGPGGTSEFQVRYVFPLNDHDRARHPDHVVSSANPAFNATDFPVIYQALAAAEMNMSDSTGANIRTTNEAHQAVSVGYAITQSDLTNWIVLVEQARQEVFEPINHLRDVLLACLFSTAAFMALIAFPLAHFASLPIRRLQRATADSIEPPTTNRSSLDSLGSLRDGSFDDDHDSAAVLARKEKGLIKNPIQVWRRKRKEADHVRREERRKRAFRIPSKVKERNYCIKDELSDLTTTFNEMSDELMLQYSQLEERVKQRTAELEESKKAAEAANESKTLFIANISHELKTPLNGILGMCAICMQEDDPVRLKRSLGIIYKSGDLLLNLLTDLLTFSKNQVGQALSLDEKEFRLRDISSQILAIFDKQAGEGQINLRVQFEDAQSVIQNEERSPHRKGSGPFGVTERLRNMVLWGDVHRILQVVINLVSNSLKFTPKGGSVVLTIRCLADNPDLDNHHTSSIHSRQSRQSRQSQRHSTRQHKFSEGTLSVPRMNGVNTIYPKDNKAQAQALAFVNAHERAASPPPAGRSFYFEFQVTDTGPGIPESLHTKIFEPFVQGDLGLSKKFGGTGLGLSICSQLASLMHGNISVQSTVGEGSTFSMKIPLRLVHSRADSAASSAFDRGEPTSRSSSIDDTERMTSVTHGAVQMIDSREVSSPLEKDTPSPPMASVSSNMGHDSQPRLIGFSQPFFAASTPLESPGSQPAAMKQIAAEATRGGRIRVLVAEDNKVNQEVVLRMLKLEDIYDVTVAKDGQEALDMVKESMRGEDCKPFNLIFMDVQMPNVDGLTSTRLIREIGYQAPIVALTAFAEESNIKDCLDSGMNYFLSKPIRRPQLKKVLKEYCPPIPEENEELGTPEERRGSAVNTTVVMVNSQTATSTPVLADAAIPQSSPGMSSSAIQHRVNNISRPVSPLTAD